MLNRSNSDYAPAARRFSTSPIGAAAIEQLEDRKLLSSNAIIGINVNNGSVSAESKIIPVLKSMDVDTVRLWYTVNNFSTHSFGGTLQAAIDYSKAGFDVDLEVADGGGNIPSASAVQGWFAWAASDKALANAVDRWEIGNEPDQSQYWKGSLSQYVNDYLKPAYESLHADGEKVVSAGPSWNPQDVQTMVNAGLLNYTDYVGFHPYANSVSASVSDLKQVDSIVAGRKPVAVTEWNIRGLSGSAWANAVVQAYPQIAANSTLNYYFAAVVQNSEAGPAGILTTSLTPNTLFYNAFATFKGASVGSSSSSSSGNTAAGVGASISGKLWNDTNGNGLWDTNEVDTGSRQVFIDSNGDGKLDNGEVSTYSDANGNFKFSGLKAGTYKISRVFPSGYKISNSSQPYVTATVATSQQLSGIDIGTMLTSQTATTSASTGNTAAGIGASISGKLWNDTDGDGIWDSGEVATGSRQVYIDSNGDGKLDDGEVSTYSDANGNFEFSDLKAGTYKISRVFPSGYEISNSSKPYVTATVATSQQLSGIDIGTKLIGQTTTVSTSSTPTAAVAAVTGFQILNAATGAVLGTYSDVTSNQTIKLSSLATTNIAVVAMVSSATGSVKLTSLGKTLTQNNPPLAFFDDNDGKLIAWAATKGSYTFTAVSYSKENLGGTQGNTLSVTLTFA